MKQKDHTHENNIGKQTKRNHTSSAEAPERHPLQGEGERERRRQEGREGAVQPKGEGRKAAPHHKSKEGKQHHTEEGGWQSSTTRSCCKLNTHKFGKLRKAGGLARTHTFPAPALPCCALCSTAHAVLHHPPLSPAASVRPCLAVPSPCPALALLLPCPCLVLSCHLLLSFLPCPHLATL